MAKKDTKTTSSNTVPKKSAKNRPIEVKEENKPLRRGRRSNDTLRSIEVIDLDLEIQREVIPATAKKNGLLTKFFLRLRKTRHKIVVDIRRRREERLTLMMIPHNEQSIRNYHITNLNLTIFLTVLGLLVFASALFIINHTSTIQEVDQLKVSQEDAQIQFNKIKKEIQEISSTYESVKNYIDKLYVTTGLSKSSIFSKGGQEGESRELSPADVNLQDNQELEKIPLEIFILNRIVDDMNLAEKPLTEIESFLKKRKNVITNAPTLWPVRGFIVNPYGNIKNALTMENEFNYGIDIATSPNAEVLATAPGIITSITRENEWGWKIKVRHKYGYVTIYRGLERVTVSNDERVTKGDRLGYTGRPRNSLESILHYEIFVGTEAQNPLPYLGYVGD